MTRSLTVSILVTILIAGMPGVAFAQRCDRTSFGLTPINDLGTRSYRGWRGGLYPDGSNEIPVEHRAAGEALAPRIQPLDLNGQADPLRGKIVLLAVGMSNGWQEFAAFEELAHSWEGLNNDLVLVNGAQPGEDINSMLEKGDEYWGNVRDSLSAHGTSALQVQCIWFKQAEAYPMFNGNDTSFHHYVDGLKDKFITAMGAINSMFPNARLCFLASRSYGGYGSLMLNPEPFAYYTGWSVKRLIEDQINRVAELHYSGSKPRAPWLSWGVYLWADGVVPRSDGMTWECDDFQPDGTHPSESGEKKAGTALLNFFTTNPTTLPWFGKKMNVIPCEEIDSFTTGCNENGAVQAMVRLLNSTEHAGKSIQFDIDGTVYPVILETNGTHTIGKLQVAHMGSGEHTITLVNPTGCYSSATVSCDVDAVSTDEFDGFRSATEEGEGAPLGTALQGNYPNPFNPGTTIRYSLGEDVHVTVKVYNTMGQEVATLVDEIQSPGERSIVWDGRTGSGGKATSGVYLCRFIAGNVATTSKMLILK